MKVIIIQMYNVTTVIGMVITFVMEANNKAFTGLYNVNKNLRLVHIWSSLHRVSKR